MTSLTFSDATPAPLRAFAKLTAAATLFLIFAGAMVTSTSSGLAVPDWPLSYGMFFPPMVGGIFYEHGHRMIAGTVGILTLIQALLLQRFEPKHFVRRLGWISVAAVLCQAILGGLTVKLLLPPAVSISHAALAEIFLCLNVGVAFYTSAFFLRLRERRVEPSRDLSGAIVVCVYLQILIGATMRHLGAGLAIPDFPTSLGRWIPQFTSFGVTVNYLHRAWGMATALLIVANLLLLLRSRQSVLSRQAMVLAGVVVLQITLGAYTVWTGKHPIVTSLHVVTGALTLATSLIVALTARVVRHTAAVPALRLVEEAA